MSEQNLSVELLERAKKIKLLLMDCDGVLTDGRLYYGAHGEALKIFHVRDGQGLVMWHKAGWRSGIISGRSLTLTEVRAQELGIEFIRQKSENKIQDFEEILADTDLKPDETAFIGDDVADINLMNKVGFAAAVADAVNETKAAANYITFMSGGLGAVREVTDLILKAQGKWNY